MTDKHCKLWQNCVWGIFLLYFILYNLTVKDIIRLPLSRLKDLTWFKFISLLSYM